MKSLSDKEQLEAILVIVLGFGILYLLSDLEWMLYTALGIGITSLIFPLFKQVILWIWFKIAHILGWINTRILLSLVFFVILYPIARLSRLFNKDKLNLESGQTTLFTTRNHLYVKKDVENIW